MDLLDYFGMIQTAYMDGRTEDEIDALKATHKDKVVTYGEAEELGYFILRMATEQFAYLEEQAHIWREELYKSLRLGGTLTLESEKHLRSILDSYKKTEEDDENDKR